MTKERDRDAWRAELKAGDLVYVPARFGSFGGVAKIDKVTPTQFVVGYSRYRRDTGRSIGTDTWNDHYLGEATPGIIEKAEINRLAAELRAMTLTSLTLTQLQAIEAIIKGPKP